MPVLMMERPSRARPGRGETRPPLVAWIPALPDVVTAAAISAGMVFHAFDSTAGQAASCAINALLLAWLLLRAPPPLAFWRATAPVLGLIGLAIAWAVLVTLQDDWSLPDYAAGKLLSLIAGVAALMGGAMLGRDHQRRRALIDWLLTINCAILLLGLIARPYGGVGLLAEWTIDRDGRYLGLIGNANVTAAIAAAVVTMAFGRLLAVQNRLVWAARWPFGWIVVVPMVALSLGVVILTASRFTAVALAIILTVLVVRRLRRPLGSVRRAPAIALIAIPVLVIATQFSDILRDRFRTLPIGLQGRTTLWSHLAEVAAASPLTGYGLGSFSTINTHFLTTTRYAEANWSVNSAHNLPLQLILQAGWPYALLLLAAALLIVRRIIRTRHLDFGDDDIILVAVAGLLLACGCVDVVLDMPGPVTFLLFIIGLLWGGRLDRTDPRRQDVRIRPPHRVPAQ